MAERRMFTKKITESDAFLDMPLSAQCLYFHLNMAADDEGFVNNPKKIQRMIGAADDDLKLLIAKNFIIKWDNGIIVIKHWKMHNYIQRDRFHATQYKDERSMLAVKENGAYTLDVSNMDTKCIHDVSSLDTEVRLGKDSIGKDSIGKRKDICAEPKSESAHAQDDPVVITLILNDKSEYEVTESFVEKMRCLYPATDVMQELRNMSGWCIGNPQKRKTRSGIVRFITAWLAKCQNGNGSHRRTNSDDPMRGIV